MKMSGMSGCSNSSNVVSNLTNKQSKVQELDQNQVVKNEQIINPPGLGTQVDLKV